MPRSSTPTNYTLNHTPSSDSPMPYQSWSPSTREESQEALVSCLLQILEQPLAMLRDGTVGDEQMAAESALIPGSSVGKHLRHVHDHYRLMLDAIEGPSSGDVIKLDYDKRMRSPPLETSARSALSEFEETQERIRRLFPRQAPHRMDQRLALSATTPAEVELGSTLGERGGLACVSCSALDLALTHSQMWFCCLHAIHHYALARVILTHELGLAIADSFGVAPSTIVFRIWGRSKL